MGERTHKQTRAKIHPKYQKYLFLSIFDVFLAYFEGRRLGKMGNVGGKYGSIWQNWVFNPVLKGFFDPPPPSKILAGAVSFAGVSQTIVKKALGGQCHQVLAGTAQKVAKSTRLCSYAMGNFTPTPSARTPFRTSRFLQASEGGVFAGLTHKISEVFQVVTLCLWPWELSERLRRWVMTMTSTHKQI